MTKQERIAAIFFALLGAAVIFYSFSELRFGTLQRPGSGFFPVICGTGILLLNLFWLLKNIKKTADSKPLWEKNELKGPIIAVIVIAVYIALLEVLGYILSTAVFLSVWGILLGKEKWFKTALLVIIGTAAMYFLFHNLLAIQLPESKLLKNLTQEVE